MTHRNTTTPRKRRRNCYDKLRARWLEHRRQRRADPAASAATEMLALFAILLGRMPIAVPVPVPYVAPPMSPEHARRTAIARRLGIPSRYVDAALTQGTVPYALLFEHIRRGGRSRQDAMTVLRQRAPDACRDWLDNVQDFGLWSELLLCHVQNNEEDTDLKMLRSTLAWLNAGTPDDGVPGPAEAGATLKPGGDDPDGDPKTPKP